MNPKVSNTVAGDLATMWRRSAAVTIAQSVEVAAHLRQLTDPRLLPARCRLFHRSRVLVARDHVKCSPENDLACLFEKLLNHLNHLWFKIGGPFARQLPFKSVVFCALIEVASRFGEGNLLL